MIDGCHRLVISQFALTFDLRAKILRNFLGLPEQDVLKEFLSEMQDFLKRLQLREFQIHYVRYLMNINLLWSTTTLDVALETFQIM